MAETGSHFNGEHKSMGGDNARRVELHDLSAPAAPAISADQYQGDAVQIHSARGAADLPAAMPSDDQLVHELGMTFSYVADQRRRRLVPKGDLKEVDAENTRLPLGPDTTVHEFISDGNAASKNQFVPETQ